jgi:hypothetical protein
MEFIHLPPDLTRPKDLVDLPDNKNPLISWFRKGAHKQEAADLLAQFFKTDANAESDLHRALSSNPQVQVPGQVHAKAISPLAMFYCRPGTVIKFSAPFNPTVESNVLKNNQNNSSETVNLFTPQVTFNRQNPWLCAPNSAHFRGHAAATDMALCCAIETGRPHTW